MLLYRMKDTSGPSYDKLSVVLLGRSTERWAGCTINYVINLLATVIASCTKQHFSCGLLYRAESVAA